MTQSTEQPEPLSRRSTGRAASRRSRVAQIAREAAIARFTGCGFPPTRDEEWRYTSVAPIRAAEFAPAATSGSH